ncbi:MAG: SUF system NifU family Fe-S cluster assembly protein [Candidatus Omnitrophica bacterium]|nr:SUF system NifU family Fe-S cluster assembly protein [Candidatus Omnitrophota bacterium]
MGEVKLNDLYQEVILDHNRRPRNFRKPEGATHYSHGRNPLCGDDYHLYLKVDGSGKIESVGFEGSGCAISKSSASMMTSFIEGKPVKDAEALKNQFLRFLTRDPVSEDTRAAVGRLKIFEGVRQFPVRVKCATLIWHALEDALADAGRKKGQVSTEGEGK